MTKRQMQQEASRLRRAARFFERNKVEMTSYYPCFAVQHFDPLDGSYTNPNSLPGRFITNACPGRDAPTRGFEASDRFLNRINLDMPKDRDHTVLALLFAAAQAETGDL